MTDFVYDGKLSEKRVRLLTKLRQLSTDPALIARVKEAEERVQLKERFRQYLDEYDTKSYVYMDVVLGGYVYEVVTVGRYGMGIVGETDNRLFDDLDDVYELENPEDVVNIKLPVLANKTKMYNNFVTSTMRDCSLTELVGDMVYIDPVAFVNSDLWKELDTRRLLLAEHVGTVPHLVYRVGDVVELLNLAPENPVLSINIAEEYQQVILKAWRNFLQ